jgi:allophanate hydrolase
MQGVRRRGLRIAVPDTLEFFGDAAAQAAFEATLARLRALPGVRIGTVDFAPFREAAALLYQGPWVAERYAAVGAFIDARPEAADPVVAGIVRQGREYDAAAAFAGQYRLAALRRQAEASLEGHDFMLVPTVPTMPRLDAVLAQPVVLNSQLGYYTNFVNFFDMAALAVPGTPRADGLPAGVTLVGAAGSDHMLAAAAQSLLDDEQDAASVAFSPLPFEEPSVQLAVVGAHLEGQPLNWQLLERGARKLAVTATAPHYRLYALRNTEPPKPGLARVGQDGVAIEVEVWEMPLRRFGEFVAEVPQPLGIGSLQLADGRWVSGFICEQDAIAQASDISAFGGWRAYLGRPASAEVA